MEELGSTDANASSATGSADDQGAAELLELLYGELRAMAGKRLQAEGVAHTLQPTALVHEAYLRLEQQRSRFQNRQHFLALAARAMRRVLLDHARRKVAHKRGGEGIRITLSGFAEAPGVVVETDVDPIDLDRALQRLAKLDERQVRVVELRFFAGATVDETALALEVSSATVEREWRMARAWLRRALSQAAAPPEPLP